MTEVQHTQSTSVDMWLHLERSMNIKRHALCDTSSSCVTWRNLTTPSLIEHTRPKNKDSNPSISFEPLIKD